MLPKTQGELNKDFTTSVSSSTELPKQFQYSIQELEKIAQKNVYSYLPDVISLWNTLFSHNKTKALHSLLVALYAVKINEFYNSNVNPDEIFFAGMLHDIGQTKTPNSILEKDDKLNSEEYTIIKAHVHDGHDIIKSIGIQSNVIENAILGHHENWDGTGYPSQTSGASTNYIGRLFKIADQFEVFHSVLKYTSRIYLKEKLSVDETIALIKSKMGNSFDPSFDVPLSMFGDWYKEHFESA